MTTELEVQTGWYGLPPPDRHFVDEINKVRGDEKILDCIQCGVCSGSCPVRFAMDDSPMQVIRLAQLGIKDRLFSANTIWICATCYTCTDRCPRGIDIGDIMTTLRNLSIKNGHIRPLFEAQGNMILQFGRIWNDIEYINELRDDAGLNPLTTISQSELKTLLAKTNAQALLKGASTEEKKG
jgi:heterodisulfide reductase subunit C